VFFIVVLGLAGNRRMLPDTILLRALPTLSFPSRGPLKSLGVVIARSHGEWMCGEAMTTKQSARLHRKTYIEIASSCSPPCINTSTPRNDRPGFSAAPEFSHIKCCLKVFTFETDSLLIEDNRQIPSSVTVELRLEGKTSPSPKSNSEVRVELGTDNDVQYFHTNPASSK
jgi:hypothetical protein